jgi:hypothetical protein
MQMIGVFDSLIILIRAAMPPLSPAPTPSTSSMMITDFWVAIPPIDAASAFVFSCSFLRPATLK